MGQDSARYGLAALILVILWIAVYWWTPAPAPEPVVSFGDSTTAPRELPDPLKPAPPTPAFLGPAPAKADPRIPEGASKPLKPAQPPPEPPIGLLKGSVIPPAFRDYTVQAGDTAQTISKRFFGSTDHWQQIMKANPRVDFTRLRAGRLIRVPVDPMNVQGIVGEPAPGRESPPPSTPAPASAPKMEYRVKPGDTLSGIALEIYGRSALWTIIRDANRDKVGEDGGRLRPGMTLVIPHAPVIGPQ